MIRQIRRPYAKYNRTKIEAMISAGYVPVASGAELNALRNSTTQKMGAGTVFEGNYTTGLDKKYVQVRNISLTDYQTGTGFTSWGNFPGEYRGNNLVIAGLYMSNTSANSSLLETQTGSIFTDVIFTDFDISTTGSSYYACIIGFSYGYVENVHFRNGILTSNFRSGCILSQRYTCNYCSAEYIKSYVVNGTRTNSFVGSLFCYINNSVATYYDISNCYSTNNIIIGEFNSGISCAAGGISGFVARNLRAINCYSLNDYIECKGSNSSKYVAGFGFAFGSIKRENCFSASVVKLVGTGQSGGFSANTSGTEINCFYDSNVSGQSDTGRGEPRTTLQLVNGTEDSFILPNGDIDPDSLSANAMFAGWDPKIWAFNQGRYPKLRK